MRVEDLSEAERALWDAFPVANTVDLRIGDAAKDDPAGAHAWGLGRSVRAEVVAALLLGAQSAEPGRVPAVRLSGARITGVLDLSFADVPYACLLRDCFFDEQPRLAGVRARQVNLSRSWAPGLQLSDAQIDGPLWLSGCRFGGPVRLTGAHVAGTLSLRGAELRGDPALQANSLTVSRDMLCTDIVAYGECVMRSATIRGMLLFDGARLECLGGTALAADGLVAERGMFCQEGFTADGEVRLQDAQVGRRLSLAGASLRNPGEIALSAERLTVSGALRLDDGFTAAGQVLLHAASVHGELDLGGATLSNPSGVALNAGNATFEAGLYAMGGFSASGEVQFGGAHIGGSVNLAGASLMNPGGTALFADRVEVSGRFFCGPGFCAEGEIRLCDARIGASLLFTGSRLSNAGGRALTAWGLEVGGIVNCCDGFTAKGLISFTSARIGSELCFEAATIHDDLKLAQIRASVLRIDSVTVIGGTLDLRRAVVEILRDEAAGWPRALHLDGFTYTTVVSPLPASERLGWLARDPDGYHPQPYEQLAAVYRGMGNDADARTILLARQRTRRRALSRPLRAWGYLQDWTVGYGYRPQQAALWLAALLIIGTVAFTDHHPLPLDRGQAPEFSPALYTLDLLLPIAGFGQKGAFNPRGWQHWLAAALIAAGWILATTIAAGVTRVLSRQ